MALSKETAGEIVRIIKNDTQSKQSIESVLTHFLPPDLGWTGGVRNFLMVFSDIPNNAIEDVVNAYRKSTATKGAKTEKYKAAKNFPRSAPRVDKIICTGIADVTSAAITRSLKLSKKLSTTVKSAKLVSRNTGIAHAGTLIEMLDGSKYVFDWHMTLLPENPYIFKAENWHNRIHGFVYDRFPGFK